MGRKKGHGGGLWLSGKEKEREEEGRVESDDGVRENCLC